ncbi:MAG: HIT family protein [Gemmatimonadetes bacterium]|nr:HIT family protein [Gemmatimonadota bacterium]
MPNPALPCPFCELDPERIWMENAHALALRDGYPVAEGHMLVIPRRHYESLFDAPAEEGAAVWALVREARQRLARDLSPDGFTVGINDGEAAGQTVMHTHIHIIPRWWGDVADPRGGIRWVIPEKARYWIEE